MKQKEKRYINAPFVFIYPGLFSWVSDLISKQKKIFKGSLVFAKEVCNVDWLVFVSEKILRTSILNSDEISKSILLGKQQWI